MSTKKSRIVKDLDPQQVEGYSQARIEHYLALGYRPYLNEKGNVKWLTPAQRSLRGSFDRKPFSLRSMFGQKFHSEVRKKRHHFSLGKLFRRHWLSLLVLLVISIMLLILLRYPYLIF